MTRLGGLKILLASAALLSVAHRAEAAYPERPIKILVGFAPGGGTDALARVIGKKLSEMWGQAVVVENKPGADGVIAEDVLAHSPGDGYTLMMINNNHTSAPSIHKTNYDPIKDFTPIIDIASQPDVLLVQPSFPANTLPELIALAKSKPGELTFGTTGESSPTYLETALLMNQVGIKMTYVRYNGSGVILTALLGGEVNMSFVSALVAAEQVKSGKLKALAVSTKKRVDLLPNVPTVEEAASLAGYDQGAWYGLMAPSSTPVDVIKKIHDDVVAAVKSEEVSKLMAAQGFDPILSSSADYKKMIDTDIPRWSSILKAAGVQVQ